MIVGATQFGGMENSSAIVFSSTLFNSNPTVKLSPMFNIPNRTVSLIAHEIAHQWFGDSVTESTWADLWLSEGFATYFAGLFLQRYDSEAAFREYMRQAAERVFEYEKKTRTPIVDRNTEDLFALLNANNYQKGAWVLHMLRSSLGDAAFFRGVRDYYEAHKNATATTEDLRAALEKASGKDLKSFFARWVYDTGHPKYELAWTWRAGELRLVLGQVQAGNAFLDPVPVNIVTRAGESEVILKPTGKEVVQTVRVPRRPSRIELDPRNTILKEATIKP